MSEAANATMCIYYHSSQNTEILYQFNAPPNLAIHVQVERLITDGSSTSTLQLNSALQL